MTEFSQMDSCLAIPMFSPGDDTMAYLNKAMVFLTAVAASRFPSTNNQLRTSSNPRNQTNTQDGRVTEGRQGLLNAIIVKVKDTWLGNALSLRGQGTLHDPGIPDGQAAQITIPNNVAFPNEDLDAYDSDCDDVSNAKAVLMANLSNYGSDVISEVPHSESYHNDMDNLSMHAMHDFKQTPVIDFSDNEVTSDINIISYSKYLQETQQVAVQDTNLYTQQDSMILSVIEQMYKNLFYLKNAQRIKPTLYDGSVISSQHVVIPMIDDEETLILEEVSRSKILAKQNDPISKEKKINTTPINYVELNQLSEDFDKHFVSQQELSAEQAFWLQTSNPNTEKSDISPVRVEAPSELPKVSLVNKSLKTLKFHLSKFDTVVKKRITPDAIIEDLLNEDVLLSVMNSTTLNGKYVHLKMQSSESCDKCFDLDAELLKTQNSYNELLKSYSQLEKHYIYLELTLQLNQEIFQKEKSCDNQNAFEILEYFENNDLKAQLQANDTTIRKLKEHIKSLRENDKEEKVMQNINEIETINSELEHSAAKLLSENERLYKEINHLKQIFKDQFDSIKKTRVRTKEHSDSLIAQLNSKYVKNADLKAQIQDKVFVITSLKNDLRKLKGKKIVDNAVQIQMSTWMAFGGNTRDLGSFEEETDKTTTLHQILEEVVNTECGDGVASFKRRCHDVHCLGSCKTSCRNPLRPSHQIPSATTIVPGMFKLDLNPLAPRLLKNRDAQVDYLKYTQEQANILRRIVKQAKATQPLDNALDFSYKHAKQIQELLVYVQDTCPNTIQPIEKLVAVTPMNKVKKVRFSEPLIYSRNINKQVESSKTPDSNTHVLLSTGLKSSTSASRSQPTGNKKNDRISQTPSTIRFKNDKIDKIMGYGDYQLRNVTISRVYYVEGIRHNLFSVGQFCYADLEVAFRKNTYFIWNLDGVDLLSGSRDTNLYTISLDDMLKTSPISLLSKASKKKS
ncbi:hypothetical protein Tco_0226474 [Tanacetum coccineum]